MIYNNVRVTKPITYSNFSFERETAAWYYNEDGELTSAGIDEPRFGYDPETLEYIGLIIEDQATNRCIKNTDLTHAAWELVGFPLPTLDTESIASPDPGQLATKFIGGGGATSLIRQSIAPATGINTPMAWSVYVKPDGASSVIRLEIGSIWARFSLNLDGTVNFIDGTNPYVKPLQDGWFRIEMWTSIDSAQFFSIGKATSGTGDFYIYAPQAEQVGASTGYRATSVIFNFTTSPITRAADIQSSPPAVISTNIPSIGYAEYNPATTYTIDQEVVVEDYNRVYRSRGNDNLGNFPPTSPDDWVDTGATMPWRMFDMSVGAALQSSIDGLDDLIDVTVSVSHSCDRLFLFNVEGSSAQVTVYSGDSVVFDETKNLYSPPTESSWWHWWFDRRDQIRNVMFLMPPALPANVRIRVYGENAKIGKLVVGKSRIIGFAEYGNTSIGIADYSIKQKEFGNTYIKEGEYKEDFNARVVTPTGQEIPTRDYLASLRAISSVYSVEIDPYPIMVLGLYNDFEFLFGDYVSSYCSLQVEGI